jgi:hypothetical protein
VTPWVHVAGFRRECLCGHTRVVSLYSLSPRLPAAGSASIVIALDLGFLLLLDWLGLRLESEQPLSIGYAHQMVFAGTSLTQEILTESVGRQAGVVDTLLHGLASQTSGHGAQVGVRLPAALNIEGRAYVANSRYATIVAGWSAGVQNALIFVALNVITAFGVLRRPARCRSTGAHRAPDLRVAAGDPAGDPAELLRCEQQ